MSYDFLIYFPPTDSTRYDLFVNNFGFLSALIVLLGRF